MEVPVTSPLCGQKFTFSNLWTLAAGELLIQETGPRLCLGNMGSVTREFTVVGGTHPVIVEALAAGNCVVVSDHSPNLETIGNAGISFRAADGARDLQAKLQMLVDDPDLVASYRDRARQRAREKYDWNAITDRYEALCRSLVSRRRKNR